MANIKDTSKWDFETKQLHIGQESAKDIIADLEQAFNV